MRNIRYAIIILSILLLFEGTSFAQKYVYQVSATSKKINVEMLGLPGSTPLEDVMAFLPEFLSNADISYSFGQYDIMIEGISVDGAANSVIKHMHLSDLKSISISESPSASQQKNSSGGIINLELNDVPEGLSGRASLNMSTASEYQPSATLNYHSDKLTIRSWFTYDLLAAGAQNEFRTMNTDHGTLYAIDTTLSRGLSQMARIYADYSPTKDDDFKFRVWESTSSTDNFKNMKMIPTGENDAGGSNVSESKTLSATSAYTHRFTAGRSLDAELDYTYQPQYGNDKRRNTLNVYGDPSRAVQTLIRTHQIDGKVAYSQPLIESWGQTLLKMKVGTNITVKSIKNRLTEKINFAGVLGIPSQVDGDVVTEYPESSVFFSPFIELGGTWEDFEYKANIKFQHLRTTTTPQNSSEDKVHTFTTDLTGNLNLGWQMAPHHHLRLVLDRSIIRPSNWQMLPLLIYRPDKQSYVIGNPDLISSKLNSVNLNYVTDFKAGDNNIVINTSLGLINTEGMISPVYGVTALNALLPYITYENSGKSNILKASLLCCLTNGPLMVTFSSNLFDKIQKMEDKKDYNKYYNFSLGSLYKITDEWSLSASLVYNGPVSRPTVEYNPAFHGNLRISKVWDRLEGYVVVANILHKSRQEVTMSNSLTTYRNYDLFPSSVALGFSYLF